MKRLIAVIIAATALTGPVYAQGKQQPQKNQLQIELEQKNKEAQKVEKQYNELLLRTDQAAAPVRVDPWQNMRGTDDSKAKR